MDAGFKIPPPVLVLISISSPNPVCDKMSSNHVSPFNMSTAGSRHDGPPTFERPSNASLPSFSTLGHHNGPVSSTPLHHRQSVSAQQTYNTQDDAWRGIGTPINNPSLNFSPQSNWGRDFPSSPSQATGQMGLHARSDIPTSTSALNSTVPRGSADSSPPTGPLNGSDPLPPGIKSTINRLCRVHGLTDGQNLDLQEFAKIATADSLSPSSLTIQLMQHAAQLKVINQNVTVLEKVSEIEDRLGALERAAEKGWTPSKEQAESIGIVAADLIIKPDRISYCGLDIDLVTALEEYKEKYEFKDIYRSLPKTTALNKAAKTKASRTRAQFRRSLLQGISPGQTHATLENWTYTMLTKLKLGGPGSRVPFTYLARAALLRHFAQENMVMLQIEDAKDPEGAATGTSDGGDIDIEEPATGGTSTKRKARQDNGQPAAKKSRGGQGKQPAGTHFFAALDKWLEDLYAENGREMNTEAWRETIGKIIQEDHKKHGQAHHFAFPELHPPPPAAVSNLNFQPPVQSLYRDIHS